MASINGHGFFEEAPKNEQKTINMINRTMGSISWDEELINVQQRENLEQEMAQGTKTAFAAIARRVIIQLNSHDPASFNS